MLPPVDRGVVADAARPRTVVHPHLLDAEVVALSDRRLGNIRSGGDHDGVDAPGNLTDGVVAVVALNRFGVGVDGVHLVAAIAEALVDDVGPVTGGLPG